MKLSKYGFFVPEYGENADIPLLVALNVEVLERLLDSGAITGDIDCGTWDNEEPETVIDGGGYDNVTGEIIDCAGYDNTDGTIIDGGKYPD